MTPFRWRNCMADVHAYRHDYTVQAYVDDVVAPAVATLEAKIEELGRSDWGPAPFAQADLKNMLRETMLAFGLSIQSIWERQIRTYLIGCASELRPGEPVAAKLEKADWPELCKWFRKLRGINLEAFPSFPMLDTLQLLGNACRHGDGKSSIELALRHPELWPVIPPLPKGFGVSPPLPPSVSRMEVSVDWLRDFAKAIAAFWRDAEYIYNESIERKDPHLEARLVRDRGERTWLPQATD